jgi:O-antigen ligase
MFALPGIVALVLVVVVRPHEVWPVLAPWALGGVLAASLFGVVVDVRRGYVRPLFSPLLVATVLFFAWCLVDLVLTVPAGGTAKLPAYLLALCIPVLLSQAVQGIRPFRLVATTVLAVTLLLAAIGVEQGLTPRRCLLVAEGAAEEATSAAFTGRACTDARECEPPDDAEAERTTGGEYRCERAGLLGTTSVGGGRVRYRGILQDPNELAWAVSAGLPFALALFAGRRRPLVLIPLALALACVVMTRSRTGQLAALAALAAFHVRRPAVAAALGAAVAVPLALLGGRGGAEADASSQERIECWRQGLDMWRDNPLLGVGPGQFTEHHRLTAHNALVLSLAETGPVGLLLWTAVVYLCLKTALTAERHARHHLAAADLRPWAAALTGAWAATLVAALFLSLSYHPVLWIFVGLSLALHAAVRRHDPTWRVRFGWRDAGLVAALAGAALAAITVVTRLVD